MSLQKKIVDFFYGERASDKKILRYLEFFHRLNLMLEWNKNEQLGFCFYLFDYNNDGFICTKDINDIFAELNDQD